MISMEFLPLSCRWCSARNIPSGKEQGETAVFAGYFSTIQWTGTGLQKISSYPLQFSKKQQIILLHAYLHISLAVLVLSKRTWYQHHHLLLIEKRKHGNVQYSQIEIAAVESALYVGL